MASRWKREEAKRRSELRKGLTSSEIEALDASERAEEEMEKLVRSLHAKLFPEEYDFMFDSHSDSADRKSGKNPTTEEHQRLVSLRRNEMGFQPLASNGMPSNNETTEFVRETLVSDGQATILSLIEKYGLG